MDAEFWLQKWDVIQAKEMNANFHKHGVNTCLEKYFSDLNLQAGDQIFVPLCGKSFDMKWLMDKGMKVLAVELSEYAVRSFFTENDLSYEVEEHKDLKLFRANNIEIYCGDLFSMPASSFQNLRAVYDRASFVALDEKLQYKYLTKMQSELPEGVQYFLINLFYRSDVFQGPPFSCAKESVLKKFSWFKNQEFLHEADEIETSKHLQEKGLTELFEQVFLFS